ncbi:MAG: ATP-binding protein [Bacillota bacterium]
MCDNMVPGVNHKVQKFYRLKRFTSVSGDKEIIQNLINDQQTQQLDLEIQNHTLQETLADLEESRNRYAALYDFAPVGYVTFDYGGYIRDINLTGASMVGIERSKLIGIPMVAVVFKNDIKLFLDHLQCCRETNDKVITELNLVAKSCVTILVQLYSLPLKSNAGQSSGFRSIITDITERKLVEKEMSRLEKLNLLGEMAASIAHEIRNPMTTIRGFLQLLGRNKDYSHQVSNIDLMIEELDRANNILSEFLLLAKSKPIQMNYLNLNNIVSAIYPLLSAEALSTEKSVVLELGEIAGVLADEREIRQVILNMAQNGLQAMLSGGKLVIRTFIDGGKVVLAFTDQGNGISPGILEKLGTPFITTKEKGTGLGLSVCYSIAARHNACIKVDTGPKGTTFFIQFNKL